MPVEGAGLPPGLDDDLRTAIGPGPVAVAVSGGGDSLALLSLARPLAAQAGVQLLAVTVDHGLRDGSRAEAEAVARHCARWDLPHDILDWTDRETGNLQDAARRARYRLIGDWAGARGIGRVLLGHTADDDAETFVMGLSRGAGLDGLSGMRRAFRRGEVRFLRPLLGVRREALRDHLRAEGLDWAEDPSNADPRFARVRVRAALDTLSGLGIDAATLGQVIANLRDTRAGIAASVAAFCAGAVREDRGDLLIDRAALDALPGDLSRRVLMAGLRWVASRDYPPRAANVLALRDARGEARTLHGCLVTPDGDLLRLAREPAAAARAAPVAAPGLWDGRWRLEGPEGQGGEVRALGTAGLALCPDWRTSGLPRASLLAGPSVWSGEGLISAPLAGYAAGWTARIVAPFAPGADSD